ncbi:hypothetical protein EUTSA_v10000122mg [Eutrema salsugineum]|uniref:ERCC4 domain-containing protein n=1 Tax=Eutrema salsugineum TaxID=72664 RepID=V4L6V5_EUTSA|nr:crossover junction endonuclease EME1A isoform X2 [Eutrema salsugineum]ESQ46090.1 hypothetical protein EUTSA_v10000122mg [Eutrema salsugineum]
MSDPILISDEEDESTPPQFPSKRARKNPTPTIVNLDSDTAPPGSSSTPFLVDESCLPDDVTVVKSSLGSGARGPSLREDKFSGKRLVSLDSDSEDSPRPETSKKYEPIHADPLVQRCELVSGSSDADSDNSPNWMQGASFRSSPPNNAIEVESGQEKEEMSAEKFGRQKQTRSSKNTSVSGKAMPKKQMSKDERIRATEEKKLRKEQEKLQKAALKAEEAERKKLEKEKQKWEKGKLALKSIVAEIDTKVVEGSIGGLLLLRFSEKGIAFRIAPNPIERSIVWTMTIPEDIAPNLPRGTKIPYVLLVYEAEDFCNLVASERLLENVSRVRDQYPSYTVCYLTNKLMSYVKKREGVEYKKDGNHSGWRKPPIDEVLANLTTHYIGVHSRHCIDEAEVAEHVVGLTSSLASCQVRDKLSWLKVKADGVVASKDAVVKHLIKKSPWLKALVAIPKVQPRYAVAVWKKYPSMKSLLEVYMDPNKSIHDKEYLLKDLKVEGLVGGDIRLGDVSSKRIYRILMSHNGGIMTDEV